MTGGVRRWRLAPVAAALALLSATAGARAASAQDAGEAGVGFAGQVVDTFRGDPVVGAVVSLPDSRRPDGSAFADVTDDAGRFRIAGAPPGPNRVEISRIGYAPLIQVLDIRDGQIVEAALIPKPVVLEGIDVYVDRLQSRLRSLPFAASTFDETALRFAPDLNVADYLNSQPGFEFVPCFTGSSEGSLFSRRRDCIRTRGTTPQRPRVFLDDAPAFGGVQELATLPTTEVYRVEVIRGCGQIRVYTLSYAEGRASRQRPLLPVVC